MVWVKADEGLCNTYKKLIYAAKADIEWNGFILVENNTVILPGSINSFIFDFELKRVYANIIDIPEMPEDVFETDGRQLIKNIFNMLLYIFGKWGAIQGIRVEHTYEKIDLLLKQILKEAGSEAYYNKNGVRFTYNGKSVVFEDIIIASINTIKKEETEENAEDENLEEYPQGLWHDIKWKNTTVNFKKQDLDNSTKGKGRLGGNFYISPYKCPGCGGHLHMSVYPDGKEFAIDTEEGKVYAARVYMCPVCSLFYTPKPGRLLSEGEEYILDFDNDAKAAEDYMKLIGKNGGRNSNSNTNMYEREYFDQVHNGSKSLAKICRNIRRLSIADLERLLGEMDEGFYRESEIKRFLEYIKQELEFRQNEQLDPYTAFRKGLKSGKIGEDGIAGVPGRHRVDYSSIEDEEELNNNIQDYNVTEDNAIEEDSRETDNTMEDIIKKYMGEETESTQNTKESSQDMDNGYKTEDKQEKKLRIKKAKPKENISAGSIQDSENTERVTDNIAPEEISQNKPGKSIKKTRQIKSLFNKKSQKQEDVKKDTEENIEEDSNNPDQNNNISNLNNKDSASISIEDKNIHNNEGMEDNSQDIIKEKENKSSAILNKEDAKRKIKAVIGKKYPEICRLSDEIKKSSLSSTDKEELSGQLNGILEQAGRKELDYLISHLPQGDGKERYKRVKERIKSYKDINTAKYEEIIDRYIQNAEREELMAMEKKAKGNRKSLLKLLEDIKNQDFDRGVLKEYSDEIYGQIKDIDMETVRKIVPDMSALDVNDGIRAMKEIEAADILPELKKEMTGLIDKKLTRMKTEENGQLIDKIQRNLDEKIEDLSRIHYYDACKMLSGDNKDEEAVLIRKAISKYAVLLGKYEYPVIICDSSRFKNGKEGFIISPDHIFYKGVIKSGILDIMDIENISLENGKAGKALFVNNKTKRKVKLPCPFKGKDSENLAEILDEFTNYLKAKPKSRSVEYLAQQNHTTICCYRCGHIFKSGNICPKCGSRN